MPFQKVKDGSAYVLQGCYNFGYTVTRAFSDTRWTGLVDVAGAYWMGGSAVLAAKGVIFNGALLATTIATAPLTAAAALVAGVFYVAIGCVTGATAFGFLKAAQVKSGISFGSAKQGVQSGAAKIMQTAKSAFAFKKTPAADFKKSASVAKPADTVTPTPTPPEPKL